MKKNEEKSQRELYHEKREKYYDFVVKSYVEGKTAREIAKLVPVGKSTVQRWAAEYMKTENAGMDGYVSVPKTVGAIARRLRGDKAEIAELKAVIEEQNRKIAVLEKIVEVLKEGGVI